MNQNTRLAIFVLILVPVLSIIYYSGSYYYPSITQYLEESEKFDGHYIEIAGNVGDYDGEFYNFTVYSTFMTVPKAK